MHTDTLIIGAGLAGLSLAGHLHARGHDFALIEARDRFGGRIQTCTTNGGSFDMGPAWFWHGQPRMAKLVERFSLSVFDQYAQGDAIFEDPQGRIQAARGFASMQGSLRVQGGLKTVIDRLAATLPAEQTRLSSVVSEIAFEQNHFTITLESGEAITANHVVLAIPPRLAADRITFTPTLDPATQAAMENVPTWMAGQAKALAIYDTAFWRDAGLSGDAISHQGPMVEIHDASPADGGPYALFGFIGVPPEHRHETTALAPLVRAQLERLFGPAAAHPLHLELKDWAFDPYTATPRDHAPLMAHPQYGLPPQLADLCDGKLIFGGTEIAPQFGGYLEGALEGAEIALAQILQAKSSAA